MFEKRRVSASILKKLIIAGAVLAIHTVAIAEPKGIDILKQLDDYQEMKSDIKAKVTMTQQKATQGVKVTEVTYYRRDKDDAFLIVMNSPEVEKGNGYLRVGDNFWMYRKNTRTFQHVNRDESIAGSNAKSDDFEKRKYVDLYQVDVDKDGKEKISEELLGKIAVYKMEVKAKVNDVDYPKKSMWVRKDNFLPLKEQSYSSNNTLMETSYYRKYTTVDGKYVAVDMMFIDEFEKGNKTIVEISGIATAKLEDELFTKAYLENLSK